jgi:4-amino-4-deoxy-L-arabinose transferase-like glycosyltransferase
MGWVADWRAGRVRDGHLAALLALSVLVAFFCCLGGAPLFDLDEGAFSEATRQMFVRGDFISPYVNNQPRFDKPILIYWMQAIGVGLFGVGEFGFRFPSAVAATLWVAAVYRFVGELMDRSTALTAAIITATSLGVMVIGRAATADALLNLLIAATMMDIYRYYRQPRSVLLYRVFLWMGLGVLTKGPVAILIPLAVSLMFFAWRGRFKAWLGAVFNPVGLLILIGVALPWYAVQYGREGDAFIQGFFLKHNVGRFQSPMENHGGGLFYYALVIPLLVLPYSSLLAAALARAREAIRDERLAYLWLWFLFVFVFFSFSGTKLPHYVLYGITPLFILMAYYRERMGRGWALLLPAAAWFAFLLLLPELVELLRPRLKDPYLAAVFSAPGEVFGTGYYAVLGAALLLTVLLLAVTRMPAWPKLLLAGFANAVVFGAVLFPAAGTLQQEPVRQAGLLARRVDAPVVMWRVNMPSFNVYSRRTTERRDPRAGEVVFTKTHNLAELPGSQILYEHRGIALARVLPAGGSR